MWRAAVVVAVALAALANGCAAGSAAQSAPDDPISAEPAGADEVRVTTDKPAYLYGEAVRVTVHNGLTSVIHAPPEAGAYCSVIRAERLEAGSWQPYGACTQAAASSLTIKPMSQVAGALTPESGGHGQGVGAPVAPHVSVDDLRALPTPQPGPVADPPEGLVFSILRSPLEPGTYRVALSFTTGSPSGPERTVFSEEFVVVE